MNRLDNSALKKWKFSQENLPEGTADVKNVAQRVMDGEGGNGESEVPTDLKKMASIDLSQIFPENKEEVQIQVEIPEKVKKSLDQIFGIDDVVDKMPVYGQVNSDDFKIEDVPYPVMKAIDRNGAPCVIIKLLISNPEKYYDDRGFAEKDLKGVEAAIKNNRIREDEKDETLNKLKEKRTLNIAKKPFVLVLRKKYWNDPSSSIWVPKNDGVGESFPTFFKRSLPGYVEQLTHDDGSVCDYLEDIIPEFQKLFKGEGVGTDFYGNEWKLCM